MTRKSGHITTPFLVFLAFQIEDCYKVTCSNKAGCYKVSRDTRWRSECESILENPKERENQWTPYWFFLFFFVFFFWLCHMACRILVPWSGIEPASLQWKHWVLTTGLQGSPLNSLKVNAMVMTESIRALLFYKWVLCWSKQVSPFPTGSHIVLCRAKETICWMVARVKWGSPAASLSPKSRCLDHGLPRWLRWSIICLLCRRPMYDPWVRKIPWRRKWQPTLVFLPGKSHKQRRLVGHSPWDWK